MVEFAKNLPVRGNLTSGMDQILDKPRASVYRTASQSITNNTLTAVANDTLDYQSEGLWNSATNPSRLTCITAGLYLVNTWATFTATGAGSRQIYIYKNGVTYYAPIKITDQFAIGAPIVTSAQVDMDAGDYVESIVLQDSGGALTIIASVAAQRNSGLQACLIST